MDDDFKGSRRGKPQQQFYRPGSGPLKKSQNEMEHAKLELHNNSNDAPRRGHGRNRGGRGHFNNKDANRHNDDLLDKLSAMSIAHNEEQKKMYRQRKPEQQIYVPKNRTVSEREENNRSPLISDMHISEGMSRSTGNIRFNEHNALSERLRPDFVDHQNNHEGRIKRYSGNRRHIHEMNEFSRREAESIRRLDNRQNSEPRNLSPTRKTSVESQPPPRNRDTRSMESSAPRYHHSNGGKPPSGRRNSTVTSGPEGGKLTWYNQQNLESMPPRFRKKFLAESGLLNNDESSQATWDGNSLVFQGSSNYHHAPNHPPQSWSQTVPARGRGRLREDDIEKLKKATNSFAQNFESGSDSRSSTPHAPFVAVPPSNQINVSLDNKYTDPHYKSQSNIPDRIQCDSDPMSQSATGISQGNGHSWVSDQSDEIHSNPRENLAPKLPIKNISPDRISKNSEKANSDKPETISSPPPSICPPAEPARIDWTQMDNSSSLEDLNDDRLDSLKTATSHAICAINNDVKQPRQDSRQGGGGDSKHGRGSGGRQGGGPEQKTGEGRKNARKSKKRRSSSRGSHRREPSCDNGRKRLDRSPHSQGHNRDLKDSEGRGYSKDHNDIGRSSSHQRNQNPYSRENSRDRRCFSRTSSGDRGGPGSRPGSRDRRFGSQQPSTRNAPTARIDPENIKLPPPPPPIARNSRNQNRQDSWSGKGSRHASVESSGDVGTSPSRVGGVGGGAGGVGGVGGGGGGRRRRRKDSDTLRHPGPSTSTSSTNWREEMQPNNDRFDGETRRNTRSEPKVANVSDRRHDNASNSVSKGLAPGILVIPSGLTENIRSNDVPIPQHQNRGNPPTGSATSPQNPMIQKSLYDWRHPNKPIVVLQAAPTPNNLQESQPAPHRPSESNSGGRLLYYDTSSDNFRTSHNQDILRNIEKVDIQLQWMFKNGTIESDWDKVTQLRDYLQRALRQLLATDIKFCETENVENHFWKMIYYNFIEVMRKMMTQDEPTKAYYSEKINSLIKDGNLFFEGLLELLQKNYEFQLDDYLNAHYVSPPRGLEFVGLALISAQKIYIFLGDLARYKELINDTNNFAKSKNWYTKANQINPKNGRPYQKLAILSSISRRKLDAVYFYMRSLMSSNPFPSARESLITLFDEFRKKYEANERKRQAERQRAVEVVSGARGLRREVWTRPGGRRTTTLLQADRLAARAALSDDEELASMTSIELNKRFVISYLHVHGKLITKIGMETLSESATLMLRQFRALLRLSPLPINCSRLLQLTALNMFAIESAQLKDTTTSIVGGGYRSEVQERALAVSLRMFGALLERCCTLLLAPTPTTRPRLPVHDDVIVMLPAIKVWCEWMLIHRNVWNPPPPCDDFDAGGESDPWVKLAKLMNLLEPLDLQRDLLKLEPTSEDDVVRLPEDTQLAGFTPLMYSAPEVLYAPRTLDPEAAKLAVRARRLLFFGTVYLCGLDPPALERRLAAPGRAEYVSVVRRRQPDDVGGNVRERRDSSGDSDIMEVSLSEEEESAAEVEEPVVSKTNWAAEEPNDEATMKLLRRRGQLEHRRRDLEKRRVRMQALLRQGQISVELEVRPRYLVPDTNCFIDHLPRLQRLIAPEANTAYTLVVPLVVVSELEGLTRAVRVGEAAQAALEVLRVRRPALRFATTRGNLLGTATFTAEQDTDASLTNDDRILAASLSLCRTIPIVHQQHQAENKDVPLSGAVEGAASSNGAANHTDEIGSDGVRRLVREVVLLTDDRNLRVKALARDLPVRDLPAFMRWAAIE
ncbi:smg6 nonsense mediated mRNA decay factor isoform X3 [Arctopsyche grandis]|uniref:smg6 nonsense mediated mRNA decay factor isoform X3 n=1 Tax=Arctopsyche grandis TaxID=121162 RepID=UPI00406D8C9A